MSDDALPRSPRPRWLRGCAVLAAALALAVVVSCGLFGAGVRHGALRLPWVVTQIGPVHLVARQTLTPQCALEFPCGRPLNVLDPNLERYYVVWIVVSLPDGRLSKHRLLMEPIDR